MIKAYYRLTKPGIVFGNLVSAAAGFFLASKGMIDGVLLASALGGTALIIGASCVFNNILDRDIDARMRRTAKRSLVDGTISVTAALVYGAVLSIIGYGLLLWQTNWQTALIGFAGMVFYVCVYGWAKRNTVYSTVIGSIAGATPPLAGYIAVTGHLDTTAILLYWFLFVWQLPHFYALAIRLRNDYAEAKLPILAVQKGTHATKVEMVIYTIVFIVVAASIGIIGDAGLTYLTSAVLLGFWWLQGIMLGFNHAQGSDEEKAWSMQTYRISLVVLTILCVVLSLDHLLP